MKFSNFKYLGKSEGNKFNSIYYASVVMTSGILFFKKESEVTLYKIYSCNWRFIESGKLTPFLMVENLCSAFEAKAGESIENMGIKYQKEGIKVIFDTDK